VPDPAPLGYHLDELPNGITLVLRNGSNACVGRLHPANPAGDDLWAAEFGPLKVMTPYTSREEALRAICAYADRNPHLAI
jgi:hypothetical protein